MVFCERLCHITPAKPRSVKQKERLYANLAKSLEGTAFHPCGPPYRQGRPRYDDLLL